MKKFKKLLNVMLVSTLLAANVIPVSAAEIQPRATPALTQFYVYSVSSEKGGTEFFIYIKPYGGNVNAG